MNEAKPDLFQYSIEIFIYRLASSKWTIEEALFQYSIEIFDINVNKRVRLVWSLVSIFY